MAATQGEITVRTSDQLTPPRRPTRTAKPSAKVREAMQSLEDATTSMKSTNDTMRTAAPRGTRVPGAGSGMNNVAETGKSALQKLLEAINEQREEMREIVKGQGNTIRELCTVVAKQQDTIEELNRQLRQVENVLADTKAQLSEELRQARDQMGVLVRNTAVPTSAETSPKASYANVARTPPASQPSGLRTLSLSNTIPITITDTLFYTINISRVKETKKGKV